MGASPCTTIQVCYNLVLYDRAIPFHIHVNTELSRGSGGARIFPTGRVRPDRLTFWLCYASQDSYGLNRGIERKNGSYWLTGCLFRSWPELIFPMVADVPSTDSVAPLAPLALLWRHPCLKRSSIYDNRYQDTSQKYPFWWLIVFQASFLRTIWSIFPLYSSVETIRILRGITKPKYRVAPCRSNFQLWNVG